MKQRIMNIAEDPEIVFVKEIQDFGKLSLRPLDLEFDSVLIHRWVIQPYAQYWGMQEYTLMDVKSTYEAIVTTGHHKVFIGSYNNTPAFLMEFYEASKDRISDYYDVKEGDYGMHILVAPVEKRIPNFTWHVFATVLDYFFSQEVVERIVVEPDVHNEKIHKLNKKAGFCYDKEIELPEKLAALAFCKRVDYIVAKNALMTQ